LRNAGQSIASPAYGHNGNGKGQSRANGNGAASDAYTGEGRTFNLEFERIVIGSLINGDSEDLIRRLTRDDFFAQNHQVVFDAVKLLCERGDPVEPLLVHEVLRERGYQISIADFLQDFDFYTLGEHHARILTKYTLRRGIQELRQTIQDDPEISVEALEHKIRALKNRFARGERSLPLVGSTELACVEDDVIDYIVDGLVPKESLILISGAPGSFKTWLALALARAIAEGNTFLNQAVEAGAVAYIDRENPKPVLASRLRAIGTSANLEIWPFWFDPPAIGDPRYVELARTKDVLVFDSLRRFHVANENAPEQMAVVWEHFRELTKFGASVLVIHHAGKAEGNYYRGSTEIPAGIDIHFSVEAEKGNPAAMITLKAVKDRYKAERTLTLRCEFYPRFELSNITAEQDQRNESLKKEEYLKIQKAIFELEHCGGRPNQTVILGELRKLGIPKNRALKLLDNGNGKYWESETTQRSRLYRSINYSPNLSHLSHTYIGGK
jgi:hypothetical protein